MHKLEEKAKYKLRSEIRANYPDDQAKKCPTVFTGPANSVYKNYSPHSEKDLSVSVQSGF